MLYIAHTFLPRADAIHPALSAAYVWARDETMCARVHGIWILWTLLYLVHFREQSIKCISGAHLSACRIKLCTHYIDDPLPYPRYSVRLLRMW